MNTRDLEIFLILAETENMQQAALRVENTPGMLSKSLKRLETSLGVKLFSRVGKNIHLNAAGEKFRVNAAKIVAEVKQTTAEFSVLQSTGTYTISAPGVLLFKCADVLLKSFRQFHANSTINFDTRYEQQALDQLKQGAADLVLITQSIAPQINDDMFFCKIGETLMQVAAGKGHPLVLEKKKGVENRESIEVQSRELLSHAFATPSVSPFCGEARGVGCDGWRNDVVPRKLTLVANDYSMIGQLVKSGQALAYLPDFWLKELGLVYVHVNDYEFSSREEILAVSYQKSLIDVISQV